VASLKEQVRSKKITQGKYLEVLRRITRISLFPPEQQPIPVAPSPALLGKMSMHEYQDLYMTREMLANTAGSQTVPEWKKANADRLAKQKATQKRKAEAPANAERDKKKANVWLIDDETQDLRQLTRGGSFSVAELGTIVEEELGSNVQMVASKQGLVMTTSTKFAKGKGTLNERAMDAAVRSGMVNKLENPPLRGPVLIVSADKPAVSFAISVHSDLFAPTPQQGKSSLLKDFRIPKTKADAIASRKRGPQLVRKSAQLSSSGPLTPDTVQSLGMQESQQE
jgi:hypothetical protein